MSMFKAMGISASGLIAEAKRTEIITNNITNSSTINPDGTPYRRQVAQFKEKLNNSISAGTTPSNKSVEGVEYTGVVEDQSPFKSVYDPTNPLANEEGFVQMPNVDVIQEMTDLVISNRAYSANATAYNSAKQMYTKAMEIGK